MSDLTYRDFYKTGHQDCGNVMDPGEFADQIILTDLKYPPDIAAEKVVQRTWAQYESAGMKEKWLEQQELGEMKEAGLDPSRCYEKWRTGWQECAQSEVAEMFKGERRAQLEERLGKLNPNSPQVYWYGDDDEVNSAKTFEAALEECATEIVRKGWGEHKSLMIGDHDGPHETIADVYATEMRDMPDGIVQADASAAEAELVLVIKAPAHVPQRLLQIALSRSQDEADHCVELEYGKNDLSTVYVQVAPGVDDSDIRHAQMELNPATRIALTSRGSQMYKHVLAAINLRADATKKYAKRAAATTVVGAARRGVPGLVRKAKRNPTPSTSYAAWCDRVQRGNRHARIAYGPETYAAWEAGTTPEQYLKSLPGWGARKNPDVSPEERSAALEKYKTFHRYDPKEVGEFPASFAIPTKLRLAGPARWTTYRSGKVDPATLKLPKRPVNYIHEHDAGVEVYVHEDDQDFTDGKIVTVPSSFRDASALVKLGEGLGFCVKVDDDEIECEYDAPLPELYCTADGKCLLIVQDKREVLAMIWGGALGVFARGIDG